MTGRFWFYLSAVIVIVGLYSWRLAVVDSLKRQVSRIDAAGTTERVGDLRQWSAKQTDARKLVSLAKQLRHADPAELQTLIDRAYALDPNSRDITLLASQFHPELKAKVSTLDPLYP